MRISVDAHAIGCHLTGNEVYIRSLLEGLAALKPAADILAYVATAAAEAQVPRAFQVRRIARNPFVRLGFSLSNRLRIDGPDLVHVQYTAPLMCPVPIVVTVHDVSFLDNPEFFTAARRKQLQYTVRRTVERAVRIIAPSEFSRMQIIRGYGVSPSKVVAVPYAVSSAFRPVARETAAIWVRAKFGIERPFVLSVGDLQPRKNHVGLIAAFESTILKYPHLPHELVLVGKSTWYSPKVRDAAARSAVRDRIRFTGFIDDSELLQLYGACDLFAFPSFYEGFGLPILEAMACGRAVACSNTASMPEVADACAILFDPHSTSEMARAIADILLDVELRTRLERLGLQRAAQFSWERTAGRTLEVYRQAAGERQKARATSVPATR
jgi:glycosyltransferase involved in cell wall biosynthesis